MRLLSVIRPLLLLMILQSTNVESKQFDLGNNQKFDVSGYVGWQQINSTGGSVHETFPSEPQLGLALAYQYGNHLSLFTQFQYGTTFDEILVYSFAALDFNIVDDLNGTIRAGRLYPNWGLNGITRINPRTRQGVIQPQAIYFDSLHEYTIAGDGVQFELNYKDFSLSYSILKPFSSNPTNDARRISGPVLKTLRTDFGDYQTVNIGYEPNDIPIRASLTWNYINGGRDFTTAPDDHGKFNIFNGVNTNKDLVNQSIIGGIEYKPFDKWTFTSEFNFYKFSSTNWTNFGDLTKGWSVSTRYDVHENVTLYANYNQIESTLSRKFNRANGRPEERSYSKDINFGVNLHKDDWMIGLEAHHMDGYYWNDFDDPAPSENPYWVTGMNITYFFD